MNKVKIEFDAIPQNEAFARMAISGFILYLDPTINDMADIKTAVSEAVTNSIIHGYDNKGGKIFLNAEVEEKKLRIEIRQESLYTQQNHMKNALVLVLPLWKLLWII